MFILDFGGNGNFRFTIIEFGGNVSGLRGQRRISVIILGFCFEWGPYFEKVLHHLNHCQKTINFF